MSQSWNTLVSAGPSNWSPRSCSHSRSYLHLLFSPNFHADWVACIPIFRLERSRYMLKGCVGWCHSVVFSVATNGVCVMLRVFIGCLGDKFNQNVVNLWRRTGRLLITMITWGAQSQRNVSACLPTAEQAGKNVQRSVYSREKESRVTWLIALVKTQRNAKWIYRVVLLTNLALSK